MVEKSCSRSHGQPLPGVRSAAMISSRRETSLEGCMDEILPRGASGGYVGRRVAWGCPHLPEQIMRYTFRFVGAVMAIGLALVAARWLRLVG